ncbi:MAG: orotidine-5'-phosphate decarboxylase [Chitinophagales bacterium]
MSEGNLNFGDRLVEAVERKGTPLVVGLDPSLAEMPEAVKAEAFRKYGNGQRGAAEAIRRFNLALLDAVADLVPAVKPQAAYYEQHGAAGWRVLAETVREAKRRGLLVILDAKRGDIGSTAAVYAGACLGARGLGADAVTVNAYFGWDGVQPFMEYAREGKGAFVLVRTSNPTGGEVQDFPGADAPVKVSDHLAAQVAAWGAPYVGGSGYASLGAVVAGTYPAEAARLRRAMPKAPFLVPGFGAQGAGAAEVAPCFAPDGRGAVVNSSRGIIFAYRQAAYRDRFGPDDFAGAARAAVLAAREQLAALGRGGNDASGRPAE